MSSHRSSWEERLRFLRKEFELLEQREKVFEEKLQSKSKVSRKKLEALQEFELTQNEYDNLLTEIEHRTVNLREKLHKLMNIADVFYFTYR